VFFLNKIFSRTLKLQISLNVMKDDPCCVPGNKVNNRLHKIQIRKYM